MSVSVGGRGACPQVNKSELVTSDVHHMSVVGGMSHVSSVDHQMSVVGEGVRSHVWYLGEGSW